MGLLSWLRGQSIPKPALVEEPRARVLSGSGTTITNGFIASLDANTELQGSKWYGTPWAYGVARKMLNDAQVRQSIGYITAPLVAATWRMRPGGPRPIDLEAADFAKYALLECLPWDQLLERIVSDYAVDGFSVNELTDDLRAIPASRFPLHPGAGVGLVPTALHEIAGRTVYRWYQREDEPTKLKSIQQYLPRSAVEFGYRDISADRILRWTYKQAGANFEGFPVLRSAYAAWKLKTAFLKIWAIKHERLGVGTPVAIAGPDLVEGDVAAAELALKEMRANQRGYLVLPNAWTFKWEGASQSDGTNLELAIAICNIEIAMNVSAGFMLLSLQSATGSNALSGTQQGQYHLAELAQARFFAAGWNVGADGWSPIERIVRLNYGDEPALPVLEARNLPTSNWKDRVPVLISAVTAGIVRPDEALEAEVRELLEFNPRSEDASETESARALELEATDVAAVVGAAAPGAGAVQDTALNGAQVSSLRQLMLDVAARQLPRQSGVEAIARAFSLGIDDADRIMGEVGRTFFAEAQAPAPIRSVVSTEVSPDAA